MFESIRLENTIPSWAFFDSRGVDLAIKIWVSAHLVRTPKRDYTIIIISLPLI